MVPDETDFFDIAIVAFSVPRFLVYCEIYSRLQVRVLPARLPQASDHPCFARMPPLSRLLSEPSFGGRCFAATCASKHSLSCKHDAHTCNPMCRQNAPLFQRSFQVLYVCFTVQLSMFFCSVLSNSASGILAKMCSAVNTFFLIPKNLFLIFRKTEKAGFEPPHLSPDLPPQQGRLLGHLRTSP